MEAFNFQSGLAPQPRFPNGDHLPRHHSRNQVRQPFVPRATLRFAQTTDLSDQTSQPTRDRVSAPSTFLPAAGTGLFAEADKNASLDRAEAAEKQLAELRLYVEQITLAQNLTSSAAGQQPYPPWTPIILWAWVRALMENHIRLVRLGQTSRKEHHFLSHNYTINIVFSPTLTQTDVMKFQID